MFISQARIDANRRNALRSTGPRTREGKAVSRANAIKHGLCASILVLEDETAIQSRTDSFFEALKPQDDFQCWLVCEAALASLKIERAERMERRVRDKAALRAELCWDDDRKLEATLLGEQLGHRPEVVVDQLRRTLHGCEWMMGRWAMLAHVADNQKEWTEPQARLAFDLLATPPEFRVGHKPGASLDFDGRVVEGSDDRAAVARREIADLKQRRELVAPMDEANRALAMADLNDDNNPELKRIRRYEASLHTRLRWCLKQLRMPSPLRATLPGTKAIWAGKLEPDVDLDLDVELDIQVEPPPLPEPIAPPEPVREESEEAAARRFLQENPEFELEPDETPEPGQRPNLPRIVAARDRKKREKSQARREAKRQKARELLG